MNDGLILLVLLALALLLAWLLWFGPRARAERERLAAAERARQEAERERLRAERQEMLRTRRAAAPEFIHRAKLDFERSYRSQGGAAQFGQDMSPLVCFGYRVGVTAGLPEPQRRAILDYALVADLDAAVPFLPAAYRRDWGAPLSVTRFNRICHHLTALADLRDGRRGYDTAVAEWRADADWFHDTQRAAVLRYGGL